MKGEGEGCIERKVTTDLGECITTRITKYIK